MSLQAKGFASWDEWQAHKAAVAPVKPVVPTREERARMKADRIKAEPWRDPSLSQGEQWSLRYRLDAEFNIRERQRARARRLALGKHKHLAVGLRKCATKGGKLPKFGRDLMPYTGEELRQHIERQFDARMSWDAFIKGRIHIDHIIPLSSFNLDDVDEARAAWALTNLRPLWAKDNIAKSSKRLTLL